MTQNKNDLAQEMCRKILLQNKSCSQAWQILGLIFEKDSNYDMAADAYEKVTIYIIFYCVACYSIILYFLLVLLYASLCAFWFIRVFLSIYLSIYLSTNIGCCIIILYHYVFINICK